MVVKLSFLRSAALGIVGGDDAQNILAPFHQVADVGQDQIHARRIALAPEQHAAIHDDPLPVVGRAIAIGVEIHPDLARTAQRQEDQLVLGGARHLFFDVAGVDQHQSAHGEDGAHVHPSTEHPVPMARDALRAGFHDTFEQRVAARESDCGGARDCRHVAAKRLVHDREGGEDADEAEDGGGVAGEAVEAAVAGADDGCELEDGEEAGREHGGKMQPDAVIVAGEVDIVVAFAGRGGQAGDVEVGIAIEVVNVDFAEL